MDCSEPVYLQDLYVAMPCLDHQTKQYVHVNKATNDSIFIDDYTSYCKMMKMMMEKEATKQELNNNAVIRVNDHDDDHADESDQLDLYYGRQLIIMMMMIFDMDAKIIAN